MTAKAYGAPERYIARRKVFDQQLYRAILSAPSESAALDRAKALVAQGVADKLIDANEAESLPDDDTRPWERYFLAYDPAPTLARLTVPVLVLNGHWTCRCLRRKISLLPAKRCETTQPRLSSNCRG